MVSSSARVRGRKDHERENRQGASTETKPKPEVGRITVATKMRKRFSGLDRSRPSGGHGSPFHTFGLVSPELAIEVDSSSKTEEGEQDQQHDDAPRNRPHRLLLASITTGPR
jgi:hypothetical protein